MKFKIILFLIVLLFYSIGVGDASVSFTDNKIQILDNTENCTSINSSINNQSIFESLGSKEWIAHYPIIIQSSGIFNITNTDCDWLKLKSLNDGNSAYIENLGILDMESTKVTSWNTTANIVAPRSDSTRSYIYSHGVQLLAESCNLSYLGQDTVYKRGIQLYGCSGVSAIRNSTMVNNSEGISINANYTQVTDCEIHSSGGTSYNNQKYFGIAIAYRAYPITNLYFENVTIHDNYGPNFMCNYCPDTGSMIDSTLIDVYSYNGMGNLITLRSTRNLTVTDCVAHDSGFGSDWHSGFDFHTWCDNITVENCTAYECQNAFYIHNMDTNITIINSTAYDADGGFKIMGGCTDNRIENCTAYNINGGAFVTASSSDNEVVSCTGYNSSYGAFFFPYNWTGGIMPWTDAYYNENNTYDGCNFSNNIGENYKFYTPGPGIAYRGANYIYNQVENTVIWSVGGTPTLKYMYEDGTVFKIGSTYIPCYTNGSYKEWNITASDTVTAYNITLIPTYNQLQNITVNHDSVVSDDRTNITINSTVAENPTWINVTMQNTSHVYNISRDGVYYNQISSDSNGVVHYYYNIAGNEWSSHDFEFTWHSSGVCAAEGNADITQIGNIIYVYGDEKYCNMEYLYQQVANNTALSKSGTTYLANASIYVNCTTATLNINGVCCDWLKLKSASGDIAYLRFDGFGEIDDTKITSWNTSISNYDNRTNESHPRAYIYFANGKGNITDSTFSHLGYDVAYHYGIHAVSATSSFSVTGNTIECGYDGITLINSNNATLSGNVINNSGWHAIYLQNSDNCIIYNNEYNDNDYGIFIHAGSDNNNVSYNSLNGEQYGLTTWNSQYNTILNNTINGTTNCGLRFYQAKNNTAENNTITYCEYGLSFQDTCYNNTIRNCDIYGSSIYDYYNWYTNNDSINDNHIINTNFTESRKISFGGSSAKSSRFSYSNLSSEDLWLVTNVTSASYNYTIRSLTDFSQDEIIWTEIWDYPISVNYEVTGLVPNYEYTIFNNTEESSQNTDAEGKLNFNIGFTASVREIQVLYFNVDNTKTYYNTSSPILITTKPDGTNLYNRTITKHDIKLNTFTMVVNT